MEGNSFWDEGTVAITVIATVPEPSFSGMGLERANQAREVIGYGDCVLFITPLQVAIPDTSAHRCAKKGNQKNEIISSYRNDCMWHNPYRCSLHP